MEQEFEFKGYFWQPGSPKDRLPGLIKFNQAEGITLDLFGHFEFFEKSASNKKTIVLGFTSDGRKLTLLNCMEYSKSMAFPGFAQSAISASYLFLGEHFTSAEDMVFDYMIVVYKDLNQWLDISGFEKPVYDKKKNETTIKYKKPGNLNIKVSADWEVEIRFSVLTSGPYFIPLEKAEIKQIPKIVVKPCTSKNFESFQQQLHKINSFLTICYFTFPKFQLLEFYKRNENKDDIRDEEYKKIEVVFQHRVDYENYKEHNSKHAFLITYSDLNNNFQFLLSKWFELSDKISASINILTDCFMNRKSPVEFYFLGLAQAFENMHRRLSGGKMSFRKRIDIMIANLPKEVSIALLSNEANFAQRITQNRNYFTHYDEKLEEKKSPLSELFLISEKMKLILIINLIKELGFTDIEINKIILGKGVFLFNHLIKVEAD